MAEQRSTTGRIQAIRRQVEAWRRRRDRGRGMPDPLWAEAVDLAAEIGVCAAAAGIGVHYGSLRSRLRAREARSEQGGFVDAGSVAELAVTTGLTTVEAVLSSGERVVVRGSARVEAVATALLRELCSRDRER
jgi:hypothetical protein